MQAYDQAVQLSPLIQRLVAPNPSAMTGPGTNTYLVGTDDLVLIDPGPAIDEHIDHILTVAEGRISHILCTHTHPDHSPAAAPIAQALGVPMIGAVTADDQHQDLTFQPQVTLSQDAVFKGTDWSIRAIHTPGHTDTHFSYVLNNKFNKFLFSGDALLINTCGRTDFQSGSSEELYNTIKKTFYSMPDETKIYPAHDYNKNNVSTIREQKKYNMLINENIKIKDFVNSISNLKLDKPKKNEFSIPFNYKCGNYCFQ